MTERYEMLIGIRQFKDNKTDKTYCEYNLEDIVDLLNNYEDEIVELKLDIEELKPYKETPTETDPLLESAAGTIDRLLQENEQLKELIKLIANAHTFEPQESVKDILRRELYGLDSVAGESPNAYKDYTILNKFFKEHYGEHWDNDFYD